LGVNYAKNRFKGKKMWYEKLFSNYANHYENEHYTKGTIGEVDFIEKEINFNQESKILDIGCGTGRHSIELAKRGYAVTGIDLSANMLNKAIEKARNEKIENIKFINADARFLEFSEEFDLVITICEGSFPLMETDAMNFKILQNAYNSLKNNGKCIFTTLNGLFPLFHSVKDFLNDNSVGIAQNNIFDLMTFREHSEYEIIDDDGKKVTLQCNERYYVPSEIKWLLETLNFRNTEIMGCKLGNFSREDRLTTEDYEMLVVTEK
jgi:cyclopropane fatty-acyl-phospholipid synthase-like methyltransferase